ncbi:hypothetical protein [Streptomyces sp. BE303]|nr:hypothetical protein [Streptomyces sp. BE303]MED7954683.1 hypothetical protein [Streptomyces sp. BE303]
MPGQDAIRIDQVERLLQEAGTDWDRRAHRLAVLAEAAAPSPLARFWRLRHSHHANPLLFEAWVELVRGRHLGRMEDARASVANCYGAADALPNDPTPWVVLLGILRVMRADSRELFAAFHEVTSRDTWNREAHLQLLRYLSPEECGSRSGQLDFVHTVRAAVPPNAPAVGVELTALVDEHARIAARGSIEALLVRRQWTNERATRVLNAALVDWPRHGHLQHAAALADLNLLAFALVQAGRSRESAATFGLLGDVATAWPWSLTGDPLRQFAYWQSKN